MRTDHDDERAQIDREVEEQTASALPPRTAMSVIDPGLVKLPIARLILPADAAAVVEDPAPPEE